MKSRRFMDLFVRFLDAELVRQGKSSRWLAARAGIKAPSISDWRSDKQITPATFDAIIGALGLSHGAAFRALATLADEHPEDEDPRAP